MIIDDTCMLLQLAHLFKSFIEPPYDPLRESPKSRFIRHTFSFEESKKIMSSRAPAKGEDSHLTVNQLGEISTRCPQIQATLIFLKNYTAFGALCLLVILDNPPDKNSSNVVFAQGIVNARHRLANAYREPLAYPGYCLGATPIAIPVSIVDKYEKIGKDNVESKNAVLEFAWEVKQEYKRQALYPALLGIINEQIELMTSGPTKLPSYGHWFIGDGKGATYLRPKYPESGNSVIEITDFFLSINIADPGP